jgi:hypothetical protein
MSVRVFDFTAEVLSDRTGLEPPEARGMLRVMLRDAGLDPEIITKGQMEVVVSKLLMARLEKAREPNPADICDRLTHQLKLQTFEESEGHAPEDIFSRLGKR